MSDVKRYIVAPDEDGIRLDRWFKIHLPQVTFAYLNKLTRTGQIRVQGGRAKTSTRLQADQELRVPPLMFDTRPADAPKGDVKPLTKEETDLFESMIIFEDKDLYVLNKPPGFAVQGGSKTFQHLDGLLMGMAKKSGERPLLVHRLDRDTSGVIVVAKRRSIASALGKLFATRAVKKTYWAVVKGVPKPPQGRIDVPLLKAQGPDGDRVRAGDKNDENAQHAITYFAVVDQAPPITAGVSLKPVTAPASSRPMSYSATHFGARICGNAISRGVQEAPSMPAACVSPSARSVVDIPLSSLPTCRNLEGLGLSRPLETDTEMMSNRRSEREAWSRDRIHRPAETLYNRLPLRQWDCP